LGSWCSPATDRNLSVPVFSAARVPRVPQRRTPRPRRIFTCARVLPPRRCEQRRQASAGLCVQRGAGQEEPCGPAGGPIRSGIAHTDRHVEARLLSLAGPEEPPSGCRSFTWRFSSGFPPSDALSVEQLGETRKAHRSIATRPGPPPAGSGAARAESEPPVKPTGSRTWPSRRTWVRTSRAAVSPSCWTLTSRSRSLVDPSERRRARCRVP